MLLQANISQLLKEGRFEELFSTLTTYAISFGYKLLIALVIYFVGRWIIKRIILINQKIMNKRNLDPSLRSFLDSFISVFLTIMLIILIINVVGPQTVSLAALIASAGLAIGLAVKDNLANFAGGVMLLFNKPFKAGDYIQVQGLEGTVRSIGILYTVLNTVDNKTIYIPNGPLSTGNIVNFTTQGTRRLDITVNVEYGTDVQTVKTLLLEIASHYTNILPEPAPFARMISMSDSSIDFSLRVWTKVEDYWELNFNLQEKIYEELNKRGLNIPFPQLTVHMAKPATDNPAQ